MLEHRPTRRDPRVLALVPTARGLQYAAADAWEVRGVGEMVESRPAAVRLALVRLLVQTRPSAIVCTAPRRGLAKTVLRIVAIIASKSGIPVVTVAGEVLRDLLERAPTREETCRQYPEVQPLPAEGQQALAIALAALASLNLPSRLYAPSLTHRRPTDVAAKRSRSTGPARVPQRAAARRPLRATPRRGRSRARRPRA